MTWTHDHLASDLASYLRGNTERMVWENMQMGPAGSPRPDVYSIEKSYTKFRPMAYEIKVSVADFRSDITSGKWQRYLDFACGVVFAAPAGLIAKDDVPKECGLIVRHDATWRYLRRPTLHSLPTLDRCAWMKLLIDGVERCQAPHPKLRQASPWLHADEMRRRFGEEMGLAVRNRDAAMDALRKESGELRAATEQMRLKRLEREQADVAELRHEKDKIEHQLAEYCQAFGLDPCSPWLLRHRMDKIRPKHDREALNGAATSIGHAIRSLQSTLDDLRSRLPPSTEERDDATDAP